MAVVINSRSPLIHARLVRVNEAVFWSRAEVPVIPPDSSDLIYTLTENDRLDTLASSFYGDPRFKWVIARANDIWLEPNDLIPGSELRIPSLDRLRDLQIVTR